MTISPRFTADEDRELVHEYQLHLYGTKSRRRAAYEAEVAWLTARVQESEGMNQAPRRVIGPLHAMNEHVPASPRPPRHANRGRSIRLMTTERDVVE